MTKVRIPIHRPGFGTGHYDADLTYIAGVPHVVIEWTGDHPSVVVPLDPKFLHPFRMGAAEMLYEMTIEDPRSLS